jgi:hypothetical protein
MPSMWNSPTHGRCTLEFARIGEGVFVQIWRGTSKQCPSQTYNLHFFTGAIPLSGGEHVRRAWFLAMGEFNKRSSFNEPMIELVDDGTITPWEGELVDLSE